MFTIWMNFSKKRFLNLFIFCALSHTVYTAMKYNILVSIFVLFCWMFIVPSVVFLIDQDQKRNPNSKPTLMNFLRIMSGKRSKWQPKRSPARSASRNWRRKPKRIADFLRMISLELSPRCKVLLKESGEARLVRAFFFTFLLHCYSDISVWQPLGK